MSARSVLNGQVNKTAMKMKKDTDARYYNADLFYEKQVSKNVLGEKHLC